MTNRPRFAPLARAVATLWETAPSGTTVTVGTDVGAPEDADQLVATLLNAEWTQLTVGISLDEKRRDWEHVELTVERCYTGSWRVIVDTNGVSQLSAEQVALLGAVLCLLAPVTALAWRCIQSV